MKQIASSLWKCSVETQVSASFCKSLKFGVPQGNKYPLILRSLNLPAVWKNAWESVQETGLKTTRYALKCNSKHKVTWSLIKVK